jgi:hypothetical protein
MFFFQNVLLNCRGIKKLAYRREYDPDEVNNPADDPKFAPPGGRRSERQKEACRALWISRLRTLSGAFEVENVRIL